MKKMNKKGFTLIEMLVVIAIIAVLVAIIIPTVMRATDKAAAATDAANLRSAKAVLTTGLLDGTYTKDQGAVTADALKVPATAKSDSSFAFSANITGGEVSVYYGNHAIEYFASIADGAENPDTSKDKAA